MGLFRVEVIGRSPPPEDAVALNELREAGLAALEGVTGSRLFLIEGGLSRQDAERVSRELLCDSVIETFSVLEAGEAVPPPAQGAALEVHPHAGVMDPVADTTLAELRAAGYAVDSVRTARRFVLDVPGAADGALAVAGKALSNASIEQVHFDTAGITPAPLPPQSSNDLRHIVMSGLGDEELVRLSRSGHLFLSLDEMRVIQAYFAALGREPTDLELETLAQTWSEHCVHKTLKSEVLYRGAPFPGQEARGEIEHRYANLLRDTIARATHELMRAGRGPECLSVFVDNAGVIGFDERHGVAFKVETHNRPSAIEPYGGAATGVGGCIRDVMGCGLGAWPIANTDVFCVAPTDLPDSALPHGVLHPRRVLRGIVRGVADYGNRMGVPTVGGALHVDPRFLGNPLVFCGCAGLIPRDRVRKAARDGDLVVLLGGRTGRDGIHGATFSSAELTGGHASEFSHAVQIGNAITQRRLLDAIMRARDDAGGCLYSAITDCGAGGLSSAVGEMAQEVGAIVELEHVPLKYSGLRYDEVWISEAQERMVLAVPPDRLERLLEVCRAEETDATVIGAFGSQGTRGLPNLRVRFRGQVVGDLDMAFLHDGLPRRAREAHWQAPALPAAAEEGALTVDALLRRLAADGTTSREWIIRRYDHEVQGGSTIKPLCGPGGGPSDAAVLRPVLGSPRGIALGCGMATDLADVDPYWMALNAIDEALRNVVSVGGDPSRTAILDNFCWGRTDDPQQLGGLVRACQGCYDAALAYGTPFISGKDSLNNEFALRAGEAERLLAVLQRRYGADDPVLRAIETHARRTGRLSIPGTLLISAISLVDDTRHCVSSDLKPAGDLWLIGGLPRVGFDPAHAARVHATVAALIRDARLLACHDVIEGGWLVSVAEMAIGGLRGADIVPERPAPHGFLSLAAGYVVQARTDDDLRARLAAGVACARLGRVRDDGRFMLGGDRVEVAQLRAAWAPETA